MDLQFIRWRYSRASGDIPPPLMEYLHRICNEFEFNFVSGGDGGGFEGILRILSGYRKINNAIANYQ
jgi:hypothetical protein